MKGHIGIVQIEHPGGTAADEAAGGYWVRGRGAQLLAMYGGLLGLDHINIGYEKLVHPDGSIPELGPERVEISGAGHEVDLAFQHSLSAPPRWPDPAYPAQLHLDLDFEDDDVLAVIESLGALRRTVPNRPDHLVYCDPAGHPFCLSTDFQPEAFGTGQIAYFERLAGP